MSYADITGIEVVRRNQRGSLMGNTVTDGPQRWERARLWAEAHPSSQAAKLYRKRRDTAAAVMAALPDHLRTGFVFSRDTYTATKRTYMCSLECACMRAQLDIHDKSTPESLFAAFNAAVTGSSFAHASVYSPTITVLDRTALERPIKCRVCGERMLPQAVADRLVLDDAAAHEDAKPLADKYVLLDGEFVPLSTVRVVELTLEQLHLLSRYSTADLRAEYTADCGYPLSEA